MKLSLLILPLSLALALPMACEAVEDAVHDDLGAGDAVPYPEGWRTWTHVGSMELSAEHPLFASFGGVHHVYVNAKALAGLRDGRGHYADHAVFAFDLHEAQESGGATTSGARKVLGVMHKDGDAFAATGGWGFEAFAGDTRDRVVTDGGGSCFACHRDNAAAGGFVFSTWRE